MPFLCRFSHKETCAPLILIPFSLVLKNAVSKTRTADNVYYFRATLSMSLQCGNPSGRLPRYARNDTVLRTEWNESLFAEKKIAKSTYTLHYAFSCNALYVIAKHRFAVLWQSPGRDTL